MNILYTQKIKAYQGKYVAIRGGKIITSGKNAKETFADAQKILGKEKTVEALYYIPQKKDFLTALCVSHTSK